MNQNIKLKWNSKAVLFDSFYMTYISLSCVFHFFFAGVFFLGSKETVQRMTQEDGLLLIFIRRFAGSSLSGCLFSVGFMLVSCVIVKLGKQKDWSEPKYVFKISFISHLLCTFLGSLLFTVSFLK